MCIRCVEVCCSVLQCVTVCCIEVIHMRNAHRRGSGSEVKKIALYECQSKTTKRIHHYKIKIMDRAHEKLLASAKQNYQQN